MTLALGIVVAAATVLGVALKLRSEFQRGRLQVDHSVYLNVSLVKPGEIVGGWLLVMARNTGRRRLVVEYVGIRLESGDRAEIPLGKPIKLAVDGPTAKVYTELGPLLATGVSPFATPLIGWAKTSDGRVWQGPPHPILTDPVPNSTVHQVADGLAKLGVEASATPAPNMGNVLILERSEPTLPEEADRG